MIGYNVTFINGWHQWPYLLCRPHKPLTDILEQLIDGRGAYSRRGFNFNTPITVTMTTVLLSELTADCDVSM